MKNKKKLIIVGVIATILILFIGAGIFVRMNAPKDIIESQEQEETKVEDTEEQTKEKEETVEKEVVENEENQENDSEKVVEKEIQENSGDETTKETTELEEISEEELLDYKNDLIGIGFNYDTNMYIKENTTDIFNVLKKSSEEEENFNITEDTIDKEFDFVYIKDSDETLNINLTIMPFELVNTETEEAKESELKSKEDEKVSLNISNYYEKIIDEEFIKKYDLETQKELENKNVEIVFFEESKIIKNNNDLIGIYSNRQYIIENKKMETQQILIPFVKNAILITLISDDKPTEYNKTELINEIFDTLVYLNGQ
jgi:hypothetical protein